MDIKIKAIAIDDEPKALDIIAMHSDKVEFIELSSTFRKPIEALHWLQHNQVDLVFLDINMPNISGLKFRELINQGIMIIFTTAYSEYAVESYELNAVDYLLKPIKFERFLKAAMKSLERKSSSIIKESNSNNISKPKNENHLINQIFVKSGTKHFKLNLDEILYVKKDGNYVFFHTKSSKILSRLNMRQLQELLPNDAFMKVHKSFIIGLKHIDIYETFQVTINGDRIPVAKDYRKVLYNRVNPD